MVDWLPEVTTEAHWLDVIDDLCHLATLYAQRVLTEEGAPILTPLSGIIPLLLVSPRVHSFTLRSGMRGLMAVTV